MAVSIRAPRPGEFGRLIVLWRESAEVSHPFLPPSHWDDLIEEMRHTRLPFSDTVVAEEDGELRGFVSRLDEDIMSLYVDAQHQNKGIGRSLLNHVKSLLPHLRLEVFTENERAKSFYLREQFQTVSLRIDVSGHEVMLMEWKREQSGR